MIKVRVPAVSTPDNTRDMALGMRFDAMFETECIVLNKHSV